MQKVSEHDAAAEEKLTIPGLGWDGTSLAADPESVARVRRPYMSPSSSSSIQSCPARYMADRQLPRTHNPFGAPELGTSAHHVFELLMNLPHHERTKQTARAIVKRMADHTKPSDGFDRPGPESEPREILAWQSEVWRRVQGLWAIEDPAYVQVRRTEWELSIDVAGVPFYGFVDRVDAVHDESGGGFAVVDYKGGLGKPRLYVPPSWSDDYGDQIRLYSEAIKLFDGNRPNSGHLYFTAWGRCRTVDISADKRKDTVRRFVEAFNTIKTAEDTGLYPTNPGPLCGWCPLVGSCPAAAADGRERSDRYEGIEVEDLPVLAPDETPVAVGADLDDTDECGQAPIPAHIGGESRDTATGAIMFSIEDKPWEPTIDGSLNPNSYSATAAFGLVGFAVEELGKAKQPVTRTTVQALSGTFAHIVGEAMDSFEARRDWQSGLHTRLRGALHTTVTTLPIPFDGTIDDWDDWVEAATRRVIAISKVAYSLWADGTGEAPWTALATEDLTVDDQGAEAA